MQNAQAMIISNLVYKLNEDKVARFILISSDGEVNQKITSMSGMERRVEILDFKYVPEKQFVKHFTEKDNFTKIKKMNENFNKVKDEVEYKKIVENFYETCGSDLAFF